MISVVVLSSENITMVIISVSAVVVTTVFAEALIHFGAEVITMVSVRKSSLLFRKADTLVFISFFTD